MNRDFSVGGSDFIVFIFSVVVIVRGNVCCSLFVFINVF